MQYILAIYNERRSGYRYLIKRHIIKVDGVEPKVGDPIMDDEGREHNITEVRVDGQFTFLIV